MNRRHALARLAALGSAIGASGAGCARADSVRTLGVLFDGPVFPPSQDVYDRFAALGWVLGRNFESIRLFTGGQTERIPELVDQLVRRKVDVFWATTTSVAVAAARATKSIPIVLAGASAYPVECGLIQSFARPGGNVTGIAFFQGIEVQSKLVQFIRELLPGARRLAWIVFPSDFATLAGGEFSPERYYSQVARTAGFELQYHEARKAEDLDARFAALHGDGAQAVIVEPAALSGSNHRDIVRLALERRIPSAFNLSFNAQAGGLISYGPVLPEIALQAVGYVDRVLRGARPGDLPVEMPHKLELVVNQKTAEVLGLKLPATLLARADQVLR